MESIIFKQAVGYPLLQLVNNQTVLISTRCFIRHFTDDICTVETLQGNYEIEGTNLRVVEYGDSYIRIESDMIQNIGFRKEVSKLE